MIRPLNVFTTACICIWTLQAMAQVAEPLMVPESMKNSRAACAGNGMNAGTILNITSLGTQSNDIGSEPIILCFGDQILINHSGDANLNDDPAPGTAPGVGYAFYQCQPTVSGPEIANLTGDGCLTDMPMAAEGIWVARGNIEGDVVFHNNGSIQNRFFNGAPDIMYFAPITITDFNATPPSFDDGSCLHVSTGEAFSVLYLNQIELSSFNTPDNLSLSGTFSITGGYPEYDPTINYLVTMTKIDDPAVVGIVDAQISHGGTTTFSVPVAGTYTLSITDPKGCSRDFVVNVPNVDPVQMCLRDTSVMANTNFCIPVTVLDFNNILSIAMTIGWNPSVIELTGVTNVNPILGTDIGFAEERGPEGILPILFFEQNLNTINLPDSAILFELCFTVIGAPGSMTAINFINAPTEISVTDDNMDLGVILKSGSVVVTLPTLPTLFYSACANAAGDITLTMQVFGGVDPYSFDINISSSGADFDNGTLVGGTTTTYSGIPADLYDVIITDGDGTGISIANSVDLRNLSALQLSISAMDPTCVGADDGRIEITNIAGGTGPYLLTWNGPGFTRYGSDSLNDLRAGDYDLIVTDANGCADTIMTTLTEDGLDFIINTSPPVCSGQVGSITLDVVGAGVEDYMWQWTNSDGSQGRTLSAPSPLVLPNLMPDNYQVTLSNGQCSVEKPINLLALKTLSIDIDPSTQLTTTCFGDGDARIDIYASADRNQSAFQFLWDNVTQDSGLVTIDASSNHTFVTGLPAGTYTVRVVDAQNCEISQSFTVVEPQPLNVDPLALQQYITQPDCPDGTNGRIDLGFAEGIIGGTIFPSPRTAYNFRWYDLNGGNNTLINDRSSSIRDLVAGTYGVFVEDANGCADSTTFTLVSGPNVSLTQGMENICRGDSMATLTISGDLTGNTLLWSTGATTPTISNLKEGVYYVSVTEVTGMGTCTVQDSFEIIDPVIAVRTLFPMQFQPRSLCNEPDSGIIFNLQIDYAGPKDYIWHSLNDTLTSNPFISVNSSGAYPFTVVDRLTGCIIYDSVVNAQFPEMISIIIDSTQISCNGMADGAIDITASGRSGQFNFDWSSGFSVTNVPNSGASNLAPGIYGVTVTESTDSTCQVPLTISLREPAVLTLAVDSTFTQDIRCFGESNGQIGLIWEGGNQDAAPTVVWSTGGAANTLSATNLVAGVYNVALTDSKGCMDDIDITIVEPPQLLATVPVPDNPVCNGFQTMVTVTDPRGGTGMNYTFSVDNGPTQMIGTMVPVFAGDHVITVFDEKGCRIDTMLSIIDPDAIRVDLGPDISVALGDSVRLNPVVMGPTTIDAFIWTPVELLSCNNCDDPFAFPVEDQVFDLTVVDIDGCEGQDQIRVNVDKARLVYIPNGFSPNGDGINEKWRIYTGPGVRSVLSVNIFDRWGNHIFANTQPEGPNSEGTSGWDGRIGSDLLHPGVYVYLVEVEFIDGRIFTYRGDVTLVP